MRARIELLPRDASASVTGTYSTRCPGWSGYSFADMVEARMEVTTSSSFLQLNRVDQKTHITRTVTITGDKNLHGCLNEIWILRLGSWSIMNRGRLRKFL